MKNVDALGTFQSRGKELDVRFERFMPRPPDKVWSALTDPARLADWMGRSEVEPRVGGRIAMMLDGSNPMTGVIRVWDIPKVLEFTWCNGHAPDAVVRYELSPEGEGTRLVFTKIGMPYYTSAMMLPGWHYFLDRLASLLAGAGTEEPQQSWRELQTIYVRKYQLRDVMIDLPAANS